MIRELSLRLKGLFAEIAGIVTSKERLKQLWRIPLYSNAFYLMASNVAIALFNFIFWIMVARLYSADDVGLASATIAAMQLLAGISCLGLGFGLIRFLSHSGKNANSMLNSVFTIGTLVSIAVAFIFVGGLSFWSPALLFIRQNPIYLAAFVVFTICGTLSTLASSAFVAKRRGNFILARGLIFSLFKLPLPIVLASFFHSFGIFASWGVSLAVALLLSIFLFLPRAQPGYRPAITINRGIVNDIFHYSFINYLADLFWGLPGSILPIIVVNLLGAEPNAYFYIAWAVGSVFILISGGAGMSLFAEGSYDEERLAINVRRSLKMTFLILVPAVILVLLIADKILLLFGGSYAENATTLLRILTISALPLAINMIYINIKRVEKKLKVIMSLSAFVAVATLGLTYLLLPLMGINGVGIAWLISQGITALVVVASLLKRKKTIARS